MYTFFPSIFWSFIWEGGPVDNLKWALSNKRLRTTGLCNTNTQRLMPHSACLLPELNFIFQDMFTQRGHGEDDCRPNNPCLQCAAVQTQDWFYMNNFLQQSLTPDTTCSQQCLNSEQRSSTEVSSALSNMSSLLICCDKTGLKSFWIYVNPLSIIWISAWQTCYILSHIIIHLTP